MLSALKEIREALEPFAKHAAEELDRFIPPAITADDAMPIWGGPWHDTVITVGDFKRIRAALALLDGMAGVDERALEAGAQAAAALRMIGSAGRLNDPDVSEMFRERIRAETRAAIAAYLAALTETKK